ncbi:MAG: hypothetical protein ACUVX1_15870 [Chloroflexota bacterium]
MATEAGVNYATAHTLFLAASSVGAPASEAAPGAVPASTPGPGNVW